MFLAVFLILLGVLFIIKKEVSKTKKEKTALLPDIDLSDRELEILNFICEGMTTPEIADKIYLSTRTVEGHRNRIMEKTATRNVAGMVAWAIRSGIC